MFSHYPVMAEEAIWELDIKPRGIYVDGTMGGGGHSERIAAKLSPGGRLIGIDKDAYAHERARARLANYENVTYVKADFRELVAILDKLDIAKIDGLLLDLGVSSFQLDDAQRGFSYMQDAPLDMRMNRDDPLTAARVVAEYSEERLAEILFKYGEERHARRIAAAIVRARLKAPITTTGQLAEIVISAMPAASRREAQHPAKRTFQGIRIEVNTELEAIGLTLRAACERMNHGGRIAVITFHSLEDRIVKETFAEMAKGCICPPSLPVCVCGHKPEVRLVTKRPMLPSERELAENPRSRSAKLRVAEKL
ncbi:MAG TPA: 16S rRNA (cytosine(1402)-N(4))-methyltransferase RsmH [Candidatus Acidoferrum sp.]|nr:16S rRNA (cytosine(1402)-N(4))-methyltransferase RsmH [Candidatus Acidoferrum sp.]